MTIEKWELEINTDCDVALQFGSDEPTGHLLIVFHGSNDEICEKVKSAIHNITFVVDRSREYAVGPLRYVLDQILKNVSRNILDYYEDGGNISVRFSESTKSIYVI